MPKGGGSSAAYTVLQRTTRALSANPRLEVTFTHPRDVFARSKIFLTPVTEKKNTGGYAETSKNTEVDANQQAFLHRYTNLAVLKKALNLPTPIFLEYIYPLELARAEALGYQIFLGPYHQACAFYEKEYARKLTLTTPPRVFEVLLCAFEQRLGVFWGPKAGEYLKQYASALPEDVNTWLKEAPQHLSTLESQKNAYTDLLHILNITWGEETEENEDAVSQTTPKSEQHLHPPEASDTLAELPPTKEEAPFAENLTQGIAAAQARPHGRLAARHANKRLAAYKIYTTQYDLTEKAFENTPAAEKQTLLKKYSHIKKQNQGLVGVLARQLQRYLLSQAPLWALDQEEGVLDAQKLPQVITSARQLVYKKAEDRPRLNTAITLLIDNSGSMRGRPIETAAICADVLTQTLEHCGVRAEVLGFTTQEWKGGRARQAWFNEGQPPNPGRLNELRHIIYKDATTPYGAAAHGFAMMLADDLLKENIDGEALLWAYKRLQTRHEHRKILCVLSDGAPVDYATDKNNPTGYLSGHLQSVIRMVEVQNRVELLAIGIGHDVGQYYKNAVVVDSIGNLAHVLVTQLERLFTPQARKV